MRWRFYNPNDSDEAARHDATVERIDGWWREFQARTDELNALFSLRAEWDLPEWMAAHLQAIHPGLLWEYRPAVSTKGHRLVITPEAACHLRPLTATILERAPRIAGWEFYGYRLPESAEVAQATVEARTGGDLRDVRVRVARGEDHPVDLCFCSPRTAGENDRQALSDASSGSATTSTGPSSEAIVDSVLRSGFYRGMDRRVRRQPPATDEADG